MTKRKYDVSEQVEVKLPHRAYSLACPQGEMGDIHVSTIDEFMSKEQFESARARGWDP